MKSTFGKRGFVTVATGDDRFYRIARNLLFSYRLFSKEPLPFALIADRENELAAGFDRVVVISDAEKNYNDKLKLFRELPFDETIFVDADCLAYGDLNDWWEIFADAGDFAAFGCSIDDLTSSDGWFDPAGMREFSEKITFIPNFNGGVYYLRNTENCAKVFEIANYCATRYADYSFRKFKEPADEPLLALGAAVCGFRPVERTELVFKPKRGFASDLSIPRATYRPKKDAAPIPIKLVHFGSFRTQLSAYRLEVAKMRDFKDGRRRSKLYCAARRTLYFFGDVVAKTRRELRNLRKNLRRFF